MLQRYCFVQDLYKTAHFETCGLQRGGGGGVPRKNRSSPWLVWPVFPCQACAVWLLLGKSHASEWAHITPPEHTLRNECVWEVKQLASPMNERGSLLNLLNPPLFSQTHTHTTHTHSIHDWLQTASANPHLRQQKRCEDGKRRLILAVPCISRLGRQWRHT